MEPEQQSGGQCYFLRGVFAPVGSILDSQPGDEKNQKGRADMNQDIEEVIAERVLLPPFIVQRKTKAIDVAILYIGGAEEFAKVFYLWWFVYMSFVIALERSIQSVGVNEKKYSGDGDKNTKSVQPG